MKVFISHKREDAGLAALIAKELNDYNTTCYLDVFDQFEIKDGKALTDHIKKSLNSCSDILVVMSESTKESQWVPFEIGMAAQLDMPTVTFLRQSIVLPEYLEYWPRLKSLTDIGTYVRARHLAQEAAEAMYHSTYETASSRRAYETATFYNYVKSALNTRY